MKNLKNNINYKIYNEGTSFLLENQAILTQNQTIEIQTTFFLLNAKKYQELNQKNYAIRIEKEDEILLILKCEPYNALLYGSKNLAPYAVDILIENSFKVEKILAEEDLVHSFLTNYQKKMGGSIQQIHQMQIMVLEKLTPTHTEDVFQCDSKDIPILAEYICSFHQDAAIEPIDFDTACKLLQGQEQNFYAYKINDRIVSIASITRNAEKICAISRVYTIPKYRGKGYARKVVAKICSHILSLGKLPYLYVDFQNPISNHLYLSLGFKYLIDQSLYQYKS